MAQTTDAAIRRIIQNAEESAKKPIASFTKEEFLSLVFSRAELSATFFVNVRSYLCGLLPKDSPAYQAVSDIDYAALDHVDVFQKEFFPSYDAMLDEAISGVKKTSAVHQSDVHIYDVSLAALTLAWCGIPIYESVNIQKTMLNEQHPLLKTLSGQEIVIPDRAHEFLLSYILSDGYYINLAAKRWSNYVPSAYILRTHRSTQLNVTAIRVGISRNISPIKKRLTYDSVYWSGVFERMHQYEITHGRIKEPTHIIQDRTAYIELLTSLFGEKKHSAEWQLFARYKQYRAYQRFFFPMLDPPA